ncbi:hypothetical protein [Rhizobium bangladeshense]|uniref:hypothetical protein n=1 Tax=Rhizobium bangladeshense TaxID=1138189 RepID=UPI002180C60F|nr:hypothetical protein [Rhizobium bangladeshense]
MIVSLSLITNIPFRPSEGVSAMTRRWSSGARPGRPAAAAPGEDSNGTIGEYCSGTDRPRQHGYYELSIMTPHVHQNLYQRYMQVMEVVPLSKIPSDAYRIPELYWLAGRWGKRYLAKAQTDHVIGGSLSREEAIDAARMILYKNNRTVYGLDD